MKYFVLEDRHSAIGHEYQLIDDERHPDAKVGPHVRRPPSTMSCAAPNRPLKPAGEWNTSRIDRPRQAVEHWLNGKKVLRVRARQPALRAAIAKSKFKDIARFGKPQNGHILLQDHGDQVWFRDIKIRSLAGKTS